MSTSTDGILFWGYCFDRENVAPWVAPEEYDDEDRGDWENRYGRVQGLKNPYTTPEEYEKPEVKAACRAHWEEKHKLCEESKCTVGTHCSGECSMYYVCIKESQTIASRGYPEKIKSLDVGADWREKLDTFCAKMGISTEGQEPGWYLVSYWG